MKRNKMSFQVKLIISLICASIIPLLGITFFSYFNASSALEKQSFEQMIALRDIKKNQVEDWFETVITKIDILINLYEIRTAIREIYPAFQASQARGYRGRGVLNDPIFLETHNPHDVFFKFLLENYGYLDIILMDPLNGDVFYTVTKHDDFASRLSFTDTGLAKAWKGASQGKKTLVDFSNYEAFGGIPACFLCAPVVENGIVAGVFGIQLPLESINYMMIGNLSGLGKTGESYLVGEDKYMRTDSRFNKNNETSVLRKIVDTESTNGALMGVTDAKVIRGYRGELVLSAYCPVEIQGVHWGLVSEIQESEAFAGVILLRNISIIAFFIVMGVIILFGVFFARSITNPIIRATEKLNAASEQIAVASSQLSKTGQDIANGATEQASSIEETTSSMEELSSMVKQNVENSKHVSRLSAESRTASEKGASQMEGMLSSMEDLNKSSGEIKKIIKVIDNIAFQTNILALNAAVEAARAGEAGMGFAVVADEVKNLANRSAEAANETAEMIENSLKKIEESRHMADELSGIFKEILSGSTKTSEMAKEVEVASTQQDKGISEINKAIIQLDTVVQANASAAEEGASASHELFSQSESLRSIVEGLVMVITGKARDKVMEHKITLVDTGTPGKTKEISHKQTDRKKMIENRDKKPEEIIPFEEDQEFIDID